MKSQLTILTTTHYKASAHRLDKTYVGNHDRNNTNTNLIDYTIRNLYQYLGHRDIRHIISLDHDPNDIGSCEYLSNLLQLSKKYTNIELIVTTTGIRESILNLIKSVTTEYFLYFEHDWEFVRNCNFESLLTLLSNDPSVNYIRFNKRDNIVFNCDTVLLEKKFIVGDKNLYLCGTSGWSNNPYLARTKNWHLTWMPYLQNPKNDNYHITIELELQNLYRNDIKNLGFEKALDKWGVYVYDRLYAPKSVNHTNGKIK